MKLAESASEVPSQARVVGATFARILMEDATNFTLGLIGRCDCSVPLLATPALCSCTNPERLTECLPYVRDQRRCRRVGRYQKELCGRMLRREEFG